MRELEEIQKMEEIPPARAILAAVQTGAEENFDHDMEELEELVRACNMEPIATLIQNMPAPNPGSFFGSGKVAELSEWVEREKADVVVIEDNLTPSQLKNLQEAVDARILDRTSLILEIFSERAKTREARLQVELANLQYMLPRLVGMRAALGRQGGASGSMSNKGSGEKQIELDRRRIQHRITELRHELENIKHDRQVQRKAREKGNIPCVALVGYTNAGKSTLMNRLVARSGGEEEKKVFEKDMLFATLDTTVRRIRTGDKKDFLLSDTVGFLSNLPHGLVQAFRATLEEACFADLLLVVVDISDPNHLNQIQVTETTLKELGADTIPRLYVMNKSDQMGADFVYPRVTGDHVYIAAGREQGLELLLEEIRRRVYGTNETIELLIPYADGGKLGLLHDHAQILEQEYREDGIWILADCPHWLVGMLNGNHEKN